jgi:hypothetical protein
MVERCPTCGMVHDEDSAGAELSRMEDNMLEIHDALTDAGLEGAINAESIAERIRGLFSFEPRTEEWRAVITYSGGTKIPSAWTTREEAERNMRFRRRVGAPMYGPCWLECRTVSEPQRVEERNGPDA